MSTISPEREATLRQVLHLVNISRDLERNHDDSIFHMDGGEIVYVLDENIFELFIRPFRNRESVETFYGDLWHASGKGNRLWRSFEAQTALITSEFLITRVLPGAKTDTIFMAQPHRWELAHRVEALTEELRSEVRRNPAKVEAELARKIGVLREIITREVGQTGELGVGDDEASLSVDLRKLAENSLSPSVIHRIRAARSAAAVLAEDAVTEPLEQLRRIVTPPIRNRLQTLHTVFQPTGRERDAIELDAADWFGRFARELSTPGHRQRKRSVEESGRALWNDARSIAFLRWVSTRKMAAGQRLVFVTGDHLVFDAYRRWHATAGPKLTQSEEPFFMRRATQYSPIFNPADTGGDLSVSELNSPKRIDLFSRIQQAVEASLLPITYALAAQSDVSKAANRETLTLKLVDQENVSDDEQLRAFSSLISEKWLSGQRERMEEIRELWQEAQRVSIGSSYELVSGRLTNEQRELIVSTPSEAGERASSMLNAYVTRLLDRLLGDTLTVWLPLAEEFLHEQQPELRLGKAVKRASPAFDLEAARQFDLYVAGQEDVGWSDGLGKSPESAFSDAAVRALEVQDAVSANRFADLALRSNAVRSEERAASATNLELQYLSCMSFRFMIALYKEHLDRQSSIPRRRALWFRSINRVKRAFSLASLRINACLSAHYSGMYAEPAEGQAQVYHSIRYLRALSERASLHLFVAASFALGRETETSNSAQEAYRYLETAKGDLRLCIALEKELITEDPLLDLIRDQFLPNVAAAQVLGFLIRGRNDFGVDADAMLLAGRIERFASRLNAPHALLSVELAAFFRLSGRRHSLPEVDRRRLSREAATLRLPLDRALFKAILKRILS
jgi:hypothetical protein